MMWKPVTFGIDGPTDGSFYEGYVRCVAYVDGRTMVEYRRTKKHTQEEDAWVAAEALYQSEVRAYRRANGTP